MTGRTARSIERALLRKGFMYQDSHHRYLVLMVEGVPVHVHTYLSHGISEYGDSLLARLAQQLHLNKLELLRLIDCEIDGEEYLNLLIARGIVRP